MDYKSLIDRLQGHKVYLQTHNFPDPDAIASAFGLQRFLSHFGVESQLCYDGKIDKLSTKRMLSMFEIEIASSEELTQMTCQDLIVTVDAQALNTNRTDYIGNEVACIDHHPVFNEYHYDYEDIRIVGACASMVAEYYKCAGLVPDTKVATALAYGIKMDTAEFSRGVKDLDVDMFAWVYKKCDPVLLQGLYTNSMELADLRAYGEAVDTIEVYGKIGIAHMDYPCPDAMIAIISDFILSLDVVQVAIIYSLRDNGLKFSIRSECADVDAGVLTREALVGIGDGGGHRGMAGGFAGKPACDAMGNDLYYNIRKRFIDACEAQSPGISN